MLEYSKCHNRANHKHRRRPQRTCQAAGLLKADHQEATSTAKEQEPFQQALEPMQDRACRSDQAYQICRRPPSRRSAGGQPGFAAVLSHESQVGARARRREAEARKVLAVVEAAQVALAAVAQHRHDGLPCSKQKAPRPATGPLVLAYPSAQHCTEYLRRVRGRASRRRRSS